MLTNLHKSEEGWRRLRARTRARLGVRSWRMEHRPKARVATAFKPRQAAVVLEHEEAVVFQPRMRGRRRVVIDE